MTQALYNINIYDKCGYYMDIVKLFNRPLKQLKLNCLKWLSDEKNFLNW